MLKLYVDYDHTVTTMSNLEAGDTAEIIDTKNTTYRGTIVYVYRDCVSNELIAVSLNNKHYWRLVHNISLQVKVLSPGTLLEIA